jgi:2-oxoglutarate ferredoxin oxidoreductase subunit alpha
MERLRASLRMRASWFPPVTVKDGTSKIGFLAYGTTDFALRESLDQIKKEYGQERGLHAHPRLSVCARDSRLCGLARARLRGGAGPRRAMASLLKLDLPPTRW